MSKTRATRLDRLGFTIFGMLLFVVAPLVYGAMSVIGLIKRAVSRA